MIRKILLAGIILLMLLAALLYHRLVTNRADSDYQMED